MVARLCLVVLISSEHRDTKANPFPFIQLQVRSQSKARCEARHPAASLHRLQAAAAGLQAAPGRGLLAAPTLGLQAALPGHQAVPAVRLQAATGTSAGERGVPIKTFCYTRNVTEGSQKGDIPLEQRTRAMVQVLISGSHLHL